MLELKDGCLSVGGRRLFAGLSFMALDGQVTCVTGPAGSGKSLLLLSLLGLVRLDSGLVSIDGELLTPLSAPAFRRMMAYVPTTRQQQPPIPPLQPPGGETASAENPSSPRGRWRGSVDALETVWSPSGSRRYVPTRIVEALNVAPVASKAVVIADDPDDATWASLRRLAAGGRTVVVASNREVCLGQSDRVVEIGNNPRNENQNQNENTPLQLSPRGRSEGGKYSEK